MFVDKLCCFVLLGEAAAVRVQLPGELWLVYTFAFNVCGNIPLCVCQSGLTYILVGPFSIAAGP